MTSERYDEILQLLKEAEQILRREIPEQNPEESDMNLLIRVLSLQEAVLGLGERAFRREAKSRRKLQ